MKQIALILIKIYRLILSPLLGHHCRFFPTCSVYAYQAIEKYGFVKGITLGIKRLIKCHPLHPGGIDFVP
jgi:putative membrane protein insertion efficiency factor